ncbi:MAG: poly-gamma-glutamate biosynthesis protein PgsC [bacterium]|nr:poly-gamma-glutamate biosynthesis protein PgsC [bacterium]MBU1916579.1 poly-gamma-glutamate biosynthesis protein PgsC [bacterium]
MTEILTLSIGIGLAIGLLFAELFGIAAGGMVVPGYMALYLSHPLDVAMTIVAALVAYGLVKLFSPFLLLYGRRRTALTILIGYLVGILIRFVFPDTSIFFGQEFQVVGYIIPGLLAIWMDRQGLIETIATLLIVAVIIRLVLIITIGEDIIV